MEFSCAWFEELPQRHALQQAGNEPQARIVNTAASTLLRNPLPEGLYTEYFPKPMPAFSYEQNHVPFSCDSSASQLPDNGPMTAPVFHLTADDASDSASVLSDISSSWSVCGEMH